MMTRFLCFLRKLNQKNFFNEIEDDKLYTDSAPARIYARSAAPTSKMHKFSSSDSFPKLRPIVSSVGIFNCNLARFLCDFLSPLMITLAKILFLLFLKSRIKIFSCFL